MNKKALLSKILFNQVFNIEKLIHFRAQNKLTILAYHRIFPPVNNDYPFLKDVMSASQEIFHEQVSFLKKHFSIINFYNLKELLESEKSLPPNLLILTFDDGYADNYDDMLPVLQDHNTTATVYVATEFIDDQKLFWVDRIAFKINKSEGEKLSLLDGKYSFNIDKNNKKEVIYKVINICSRIPDELFRVVICEIYSQLLKEPNSNEFNLAKPLSWNQVTSLSNSGIEIGAHTVTHGFLNNMTYSEQVFELKTSKEKIEKEIGKPIVSAAYPAGMYNQETLKVTNELGFDFACNYKHAIAKFDNKIRYELPRIHIDDFVELPLFKAYTSLPEIFL